MRHALLKIALVQLFLTGICCPPAACAQEIAPNLNFGKPTMDELSMTVYTPDSSAVAVVLCSRTVVSYDWGYDDFRLLYERKVKVKVLKPEGTSRADITIPYYDKKSSGHPRDVVSNLNASAYNLENGKIVRTKMKDDVVFRERIDDYYMRVKFSIPQVKEGTVFEYSYKYYSDFYYDIDSWKAQEAIPTLYTDCTVIIPEYFRFNVDNHGWEQLTTDRKSVNISLHIQGGMLQCSGTEYYFRGDRLPALKDDDYVWCADDYCTQVNLELSAIEIPGSYYKSYSQNWKSVDEMLRSNDSFGGRLRMSNPLKEEMAALGIASLPSVPAKAAAIYMLLKSKVRWNGKYALLGNPSRQILKEGTGDNADINFVLLSMLRDADIKAYPVVLSTRTHGRLPLSHPSVEKLNTFVVAIAVNDSVTAYIDGSVEAGTFNVLPTNLLVERARTYTANGEGRWVNLQRLCKNSVRSVITASLSPEGMVSGTRQAVLEGEPAAQLRRRIRSAKDSTDYVAKLTAEEQMEVTSLTWKGERDFSARMQENVGFRKQCEVNGDFIYVNPMIFPAVTESPFTQANRRLPVEYPYYTNVQYVVTLELPEGYVVDEMPQNLNISVDEKNALTMRYQITQRANMLTMRYIFNRNQLLFMPDKYIMLQAFWEKLAEKNTEMMVLKKLKIEN